MIRGMTMLGIMSISLACEAGGPILMRTSAEPVADVPVTNWSDPSSYYLCVDYGTNATQLLDNSGLNQHLTVSNWPAMTIVTNNYGYEGDYFYFEGNQCVTGVMANISATTMTASCWAKFNTLTNSAVLFGQWNTAGTEADWLLSFGEFAGTGKLRFQIRQTDKTVVYAPLSASLSTNTWYYIVGVADAGNKVRLYTNGVECGVASNYDGTIENAQCPVRVATHSDWGYRHTGYLDFITYSPYARSAAAITQEYLKTYPTNNMRIHTP